jgi:hypothetical protein
MWQTRFKENTDKSRRRKSEKFNKIRRVHCVNDKKRCVGFRWGEVERISDLGVLNSRSEET